MSDANNDPTMWQVILTFNFNSSVPLIRLLELLLSKQMYPSDFELVERE
jgi:hypothetical protein